ncbi:SOS response-associated peptidase family protein [Paraburkholderia sejongensis]|uniref:SOS response-associated peptidase family protein n=1 Tax=Paraburkholderia sejongensis TaxID=2886946 RepID=UPI002E778B12|nr:SOS response-associated peptidase family protein [Paraburkholderia sp. MMS20-SJTR3]
MCTSYEAPGKIEFDAFSLFPTPSFDYRGEIYKDYVAPIFRRVDGELSTDAATFGMVPRERIPPRVKVFDTMNARSETVGQKRSFSGAWNRLQLTLIPCRRFYEPSYETGKPVRWRIGLADNDACAIAGPMASLGQPGRLTDVLDDHAYVECRRAPVDEAVPQARRREARRRCAPPV